MNRREILARIDADMARAARMPLSECIGFMANYGATLHALADESGEPFEGLRAYTDKAYEKAVTAVSA